MNSEKRALDSSVDVVDGYPCWSLLGRRRNKAALKVTGNSVVLTVVEMIGRVILAIESSASAMTMKVE